MKTRRFPRPPKKFVLQLARIEERKREIQKDRGREHEERLITIFERFPGERPPWLSSLHRSSEEQDRTGIDVVATTDVGDLYLQVKSSLFGKERFLQRRRRHPIGIIVIDAAVPDARILEEVLQNLTVLRERFLEKRST